MLFSQIITCASLSGQLLKPWLPKYHSLLVIISLAQRWSERALIAAPIKFIIIVIWFLIDSVCLAMLSYCIAIKLHTGSTDMCGPARGVVFLTHHHQMRKNRRIFRTAAVLLLLCNLVNADKHVSSVSISPTGVSVSFFFKQRSKSWSYIRNLGLLQSCWFCSLPSTCVMVGSRCFPHTNTGSCELPDFCVTLEMLLAVISQTIRCHKETVTSCLHDCCYPCSKLCHEVYNKYTYMFSYMYVLFNDLISQMDKL